MEIKFLNGGLSNVNPSAAAAIMENAWRSDPILMLEKVFCEQLPSNNEQMLRDAALILAARLIEASKQIHKLEFRSQDPDHLLDQLEQRSGKLNDTTHLEKLGNLVYRVYENINPDIVPSETEEEVRVKAERLKELAGEIETAHEEFFDEDDYDEEDNHE